jgi:poly-beta-hydroxyalkanoate depolymerase
MKVSTLTNCPIFCVGDKVIFTQVDNDETLTVIAAVYANRYIVKWRDCNFIVTASEIKLADDVLDQQRIEILLSFGADLELLAVAIPPPPLLLTSDMRIHERSAA